MILKIYHLLQNKDVNSRQETRKSNVGNLCLIRVPDPGKQGPSEHPEAITELSPFFHNLTNSLKSFVFIIDFYSDNLLITTSTF